MQVSKLKSLMSSQLICNASWLGGAELVNRIFRLGATVILARTFSITDYGLVAIIYTIIDFTSVFTLRNGIGAKIIQADIKDLGVICDTSYWLNWILCISLFVFQCTAAFPISIFYGNNFLILPICFSALNYLILPNFLIQSALIQRENKFKVIAICNLVQSLMSNIVTIALALFGAGIWAVVIPIVVTAPVWIFLTYINNSWRPPKKLTLKRWQEVISFGKNMLGVDLLGRLRANIDYLLIGRFMGAEALGIYYFAFNAGFGISLSMMSFIMSSLFPHLCQVRNDYEHFKRRYIDSIKMLALIFVPIVFLQSSLAPFYVPIVFGDKWTPAIPILIVICLSALPHAFWWASSMALNALDRTIISLGLDLLLTSLLIILVLIAIYFGTLWVAFAVLISNLIAVPIYFFSVKKSFRYHFEPS